MTLPKIIRLEVSLKDAREVERLRKRVEELEQEASELRQLKNRFEFDLVCQQRLNLQLQDYCREAGYTVPKRLFTIWESTYKTSGHGPK